MLSHRETKLLLEFLLKASEKSARKELHAYLQFMGSNEGEFYASIVAHSKGMNLTSEQWFDLLTKLPNRILRSQISLKAVLSPEQIEKLPPVTG